MGTLFSSLDIARAGMFAAQVQLDTTAHNIANVNTEGFSRQRVRLTERAPILYPFGAIGRGPAVVSIERVRDLFLDTITRDAFQGLGFSEEQAPYFARIQDLLQEPSDVGLNQRFTRFFDALNAFATNVAQAPARVAFLEEARSLVTAMNQTARTLFQLRSDANDQAAALVEDINALTTQIAEQNERIRQAEGTGQPANDLRDQRDVLLDRLSRIVNIEWRERESGEVDVLLGGEELVVGTRARALAAVRDTSIDPDRPDLYAIRFTDNNALVPVYGGQLAGVLEARDNLLGTVDDQLNALARDFIYAFNRIHSQGRGLAAYASTVTSAYAVSDANQPLNNAGLPFTVQDGSFDIVVYDNAGNVVETVTVNVVASGPPAGQTTLNQIAAAINGATNVSASISSDGRLLVNPAAGFSLRFANDTAAFLPAIGLNGLFVGKSAMDMAVNSDLLNNPALLSSAYTTDLSTVGDNAAALDMLGLRNAPFLDNNTQTLNQFYEGVLTFVGVRARSNEQSLQTQQAFADDFQRRRLEMQGVNLDEEVTNLLLVQRAFEASARIVTTTDRMLETLLGIVA